jgi:prepilin-type N-terminal cleavage/methylation domain-containing protein
MRSTGMSGFSIVEIVVVLALMGIVLAIALPGWRKLLPSYHLSSAARQIQSELHNIKMRAAAENVPFQLAYADASAVYTIQRDLSALVTKPLSDGIVITKAGTVSFSPRGTASANRVRLRNPSGQCKQVVISPTGRVRICSPSDCNLDC